MLTLSAIEFYNALCYDLLDPTYPHTRTHIHASTRTRTHTHTHRERERERRTHKYTDAHTETPTRVPRTGTNVMLTFSAIEFYNALCYDLLDPTHPIVILDKASGEPLTAKLIRITKARQLLRATSIYAHPHT